MCIIFVAINQHTDYPLLLAANRDENHNRPSLEMHYWETQPNILAGRDLLKGGSWIGINKSGEFCAVTNFRTGLPANPEAISRGLLVNKYLSNNTTKTSFNNYLLENADQYPPFNVVYGTAHHVTVFCSPNKTSKILQSGFHSISNGYLDDPWPKMSRGVNRLNNLIKDNRAIKINQLNRIMRDHTQAKAHLLPNTGVDKLVEQKISSIFIQDKIYGTRTTTYLLYGHADISAHEINYAQNGQITTTHEFSIPAPKS